MALHKIQTEGGTVTTRTTHPYVLISGVRVGKPYIVGYAASADGAMKRRIREGRKGTFCAIYRVADGHKIGA